MARIDANSIVEIDGRRVPATFCRPFDEHGRKLEHVVWIDPEAGTFGQHVTGPDGVPAIDETGPHPKLIEIVRFGKVTLRPGDDSSRPPASRPTR
jgi:hypothetical protein